MAKRVRERLGSRSRSERIGGKVIGQRELIVYEDTGASLIVEDALARITTDDAGNSYTGFVAGDPWPDDPELFAQRPSSAERVEGHNDLIEVVWLYENVPAVPPGVPKDGDVGYVDEQASQHRDFVKVYRIETDKGFLVFPVNGQGDVTIDDLSKDILGVPVDIRGHRTTNQIYRVAGSITEIVEGPVNWPFLGTFASKRNSEPFFGGDVGKVVYAGPTSRSVGTNKTAITHEFFYDDWFHLAQIADRDQNGDINLILLSDPPGPNTPMVAKRVYWRQPFPEKADFHQLSKYFGSGP